MVDRNGRTPLHLAVINGMLKMCLIKKCKRLNRKAIERLLKNNADTTIKDMYGKTPMDIAMEDGN